MEEIWKDIPNYKGYQASNLGRIRTYNKITYTKKHGVRHWKNKILKFKEKVPKSHGKHQGKYGTGYRVDLWKDGKAKTFLVCRLVATTFLENLIDTDMTINHKDGNRLNNNINNLEWLSRKDNIIHGYENGLYSNQKSVLIIDKKNNNHNYFNSLSKASEFIGKNKKYLSCQISRGKFKNKEYEWRING